MVVVMVVSVIVEGRDKVDCMVMVLVIVVVKICKSKATKEGDVEGGGESDVRMCGS